MSKRRPYIFIYIIGLLALALLSACQPTRFISEPDTLLRSVRLESASKQVNPSDFRPYVRQEPNARWFSIAKVPLSLYCLSPADTTRRRGRFFRRVGEAPVVYDASLAEYSRQALQSALQAKGYVHATVTADTVTRRRKTDVTYRLQPGRRYYVREVRRAYDDDSVKVSVERSNGNSLLYRGMPLDVSLLTEERARIVSQLQNEGFYRVHKEFVSYRVDTIRDDTGVELTLQVARPVGIDSNKVYERFRFRNVTLREHGVEGAETDSLGGGSDELVLTPQHGLSAFGSYREAKRFFSALPPRVAGIRRAVLLNHVPLRPDSLFRERDFQSSYSGLNALQALNYSTIRLREVPGDSALLDAEVGLVPGKPHSVSAELEGTNTSGDLGAAVSLTYSNRNLFRGAEVLSLKVRGAYEAITGLEGYSDENYFEYGAEASLRFPAHRLPFLPRRQRRHLKATSDIRLMYDSQNRPEFHRRVLTGNWAYRWNHLAHPGLRHRFDILSLNYIFMPWISETFRTEYLEGEDPRYSILRSSYENLFIMSTAYSFVYNSQQDRERSAPAMTGRGQLARGWQLRFSVESAGNLLFALSKLTRAKRHDDGMYHYLDNSYSQYVKTELDFARLVQLDERNTFALHAYFGLALPYGNSSVIPYEKRFFSGGANSVRGWSVRGLGPGGYRGKDGRVDFINQTGNLKLDVSAEWRTRLFWKFDGAFFVDAGNVWNTRRYELQEDGAFRWRTFYKQIAVSYGLGVRFNLDYFVLRFDGGMKAVNPAYENSRQHFPLVHPKLSRDFAFHFAVGLPF